MKKFLSNNLLVPIDIDPLLSMVSFYVNCSIGCSINCSYCYEKIKWSRRKNGNNTWNKMINVKLSSYIFRKFHGIIEFPSRHDITSKNVYHYINYLNELLLNDNIILITTKPSMKIIKKILLITSPDDTIFRLSITNTREETRKKWEPDGSSYEERLKVLEMLYKKGYNTYVNIEPALENPVKICKDVIKHVTGNINIGLMVNKMKEKLNLSLDYLKIYYQCKSISNKILFRNSFTNKINGTKICNCSLYGFKPLLT